MSDEKNAPPSSEDGEEQTRASSPKGKGRGTNKQRAGLRVESLEPRILLSASWVDADMAGECAAADDVQSEEAVRAVVASEDAGPGIFDQPASQLDLSSDEASDDEGDRNHDDGERDGKDRDGERDGKDRDGERHGKDRDGERDGKDRDGERDGKDRDGERHGKDRDGERDGKDRDGERDGKDRDGERHGKDRDGERHGKDRDGERDGKDRDGERHGKDRDGERDGKDRDGERHGKDRDGERDGKDRDGERHGKDRDGERDGKDRDDEGGEPTASESRNDPDGIVAIPNPEPGTTYNVEPGTTAIDLSSFDRADAHFEQGAINVDLGEGESFRIEHQGLDSVEFGGESVDFVVWGGEGSSSDWADPVNWEGDSMPDHNDILVFDATSSDGATLAGANLEVGGIQVAEDYRGTIVLDNSITVEGDLDIQGGRVVVSDGIDIDGDLRLNGGRLEVGDATVSVEGDFEVAGGEYVASSGVLQLDGAGDQTLHADGTRLPDLVIDKTDGTLTLTGDLNVLGDFTHVAGEVEATGSTVTFQGNGATLSAPGIALDDVRLDAGTLTIEGGLDVDGDLSIERLYRLEGDTLHVEGNVTTIDTSIGGSAVIVLDGSADQVVDAAGDTGELRHLSIDKAEGSVTLQDHIQISGDFTHVAGEVEATGSTVTFQGNGATLSAPGIALDDVRLDAGTLTIEGGLDVDGDLSIERLYRLEGDTLHVEGNVTTIDTSIGGSAVIVLDGSADQVVDAAGGTGELRHLTIDKAEGSVTLQDHIQISGDFTHVAGEVEATGSTVTFQGNGATLSAPGIALDDVRLDAGTLTIEGGLDVDGDLSIERLYRLEGDTLHVEGNVTTIDTSIGGSAVIVLDGSADQVVDAAGGTGELRHLSIDKAEGSVTLQDHIQISGDFTHVAGEVEATGSTVTFQGNGATLSAPGIALDDVRLDAGTLTIEGGLDVDGDLSIERLYRLEGDTLHVEGNVTTIDTSIGGSAVIVLDGSADQVVDAAGGTGELRHLTIDKAEGSVTLQDHIQISGDFTHVAGEVEATGSTVTFQGNGATLSAPGIALDDVRLDAGTLTIEGGLDVDGDLSIERLYRLEGDTLHVEGNVTTIDTSIGGSAVIVLDGSADQVVDAAGGTGELRHLTIDKAEGSVTLQDHIQISGDFTHVAGEVEATGSTVTFQGNGATLSAPGIALDDVRLDAGTLTIEGGLDVDGDLSIERLYRLEGDTLHVEGNVEIEDANFGGSGRIVSAMTISVDEDGAQTSESVIDHVIDASGDTLSLDSFTQPENGTVVHEGDGRFSYTPNTDFNGTDSFTYTVTDEKGDVTSDTVMITIADDMQEHLVDAGADMAVQEGEAVSLGASTREYGDAEVTYQWTQLEGPPVSVAGADSADPSFTAPNLAASQDLVFQVEVSDGTHVTTDTLVVAVQASDEAPIIEAGHPIEAAEGESVRLTARAADVEGQDMQFRWTQVSGTPVTLTEADSLSPTFEAPEGLVNSDLVFQLEANDGTHSVTDQVTVTVAANDDAPSVQAGLDQQVEENQTVQLGARADDPEGRPLAYQWTQLEGPPVSVAGADSADPSFTAPNLAASQDLVFQVEVSDGTHVTTDTLVVAVQASDEAPIIEAGHPIEAAEGESVRLTARAADVEGQDMQFRWTQVSGTPVTLTEADSLSPTFEAPEGLVNSDLVFQLEANDGTHSVTDQVTVTVAANDDAPSVQAGLDQQVEENQTVQLGARADDPEGRPLAYQWTQLEGPPVSVAGADSADPSFTAPNLAASQDLVFQVEVSDGTHVTTDTLVVAVQASDEAPIIEAGHPIEAAEGESVRLTARAADVEGQDMQFRWTQVSGTPVTLTEADSLSPTFEAPEGLVNSDLVFQLEANDGTHSVTDQVTVTVAANDDAPSVQAGLDQQVEENQTVQLGARADDPEGRPLSYQWTQLEGPPVSVAGADSADPSFTAPNLAASQDLVFQVEVSDGTHVTTDTLVVAVQASDEAPIIEAGHPIEAAEGESVRLTARAADVEGQDMQFRWTQVSGTPVTLTEADSLSPTFEAPEGLVNSDLVFQLEANDGTHSVTDQVTVTVAANDDAPSVQAGLDQQVEENQTVQLGARADDPEGRPLAYQWTQLEGPPVSVAGADSADPSFTAPNLAASQDLVFQVEVSDGTHVTTDTLVVAVQASDEAPIIEAGHPIEAAEGESVRLTARAADVEGQDMQFRWTQVSGTPVTLTEADSLSPTFEAPEGLVNSDLVFQLEANDGTHSVTDQVTVTVAANDDAPSVQAGLDQQVEENQTVQLGARADDPEGRPLAYQWTQLEGPPVSVAGADSADPSFTAPNLAASQDLVFQVEVSDGTHVTTDTLVVAVQASDEAPESVPPLGPFTMDEIDQPRTETDDLERLAVLDPAQETGDRVEFNVAQPDVLVSDALDLVMGAETVEQVQEAFDGEVTELAIDRPASVVDDITLAAQRSGRFAMAFEEGPLTIGQIDVERGDSDQAPEEEPPPETRGQNFLASLWSLFRLAGGSAKRAEGPAENETAQTRRGR